MKIPHNVALKFHPILIPLTLFSEAILNFGGWISDLLNRFVPSSCYKMKAFRLFPVIAILSIGLLLAGCAGLTKSLEPPRVSLADIRVENFTGFETVFQIQLRVINTNDVDLNVKGLEAQLEINGQPFATGVSNTPVKIPSFGTELVTVAVYSSVIKMFQSVYGLHESEDLQYRLNGKLRVSGDSTFATTLPFESAGEVTLNSSKKLEFR